MIRVLAKRSNREAVAVRDKFGLWCIMWEDGTQGRLDDDNFWRNYKIVEGG